MFHPKTIENMIITILVLLSTVAMFIIGKIRADIRPGDRVPWSRFLFGFDSKTWLMVIISTIQV